MNEKDFANLERTARKIRDPDERDRALAAIAEARDLEAQADRLRSGSVASGALHKPRAEGYWAGVRQRWARTWRSRERFCHGYRALDYLKLLLGVIALAGMCLALLCLVAPLARWQVYGPRPDILTTLVAWAGLALSCAIVSWLLMRRPARMREAVAQDPVKRAFARRKLTMHMLVVGLTVLWLAGMAWVSLDGERHPFLVITLFTVFFGGYFLLEFLLWRCPACKEHLPARNSLITPPVRVCPACGVDLR